MTSKEAVHYIKAGAWYVGKVNNELKQLPLWEHEIEIIEKDLEVLEILKDKLPHITTLRVMEYESTYELYNDINITSITKEEYKLLKEWLDER